MTNLALRAVGRTQNACACAWMDIDVMCLFMCGVNELNRKRQGGGVANVYIYMRGLCLWGGWPVAGGWQRVRVNEASR